MIGGKKINLNKLLTVLSEIWFKNDYSNIFFQYTNLSLLTPLLHAKCLLLQLKVLCMIVERVMRRKMKKMRKMKRKQMTKGKGQDLGHQAMIDKGEVDLDQIIVGDDGQGQGKQNFSWNLSSLRLSKIFTFFGCEIVFQIDIVS